MEIEMNNQKVKRSNIPKVFGILGMIWLICLCLFPQTQRITLKKGESTIVNFFSFGLFGIGFHKVNVTLYYNENLKEWVIVVQEVGEDKFRRAHPYDPDWFDKIKEEGKKFDIGHLFFKPVQRLDDGYIFDVQYNSLVFEEGTVPHGQYPYPDP
jgi:hypothetical protein